MLAGPYATMLLADLGADVVKVEPPEGDATRGWGPPWVGEGEARTAAYFLAANRNKRSLRLDLKAEAGRDVLRRLLGRADVLVENQRVGGFARLGFDDATLEELNPRLVHLAISGYGPTGPEAGTPGYDFIVQAVSGLMSITGFSDAEGGAPTKVGVAVTDLATGMLGATAILAALVGRDRPGSPAAGRGQRIDISLLDSTLAWLANQAQNYFVTGEPPGRRGNAHPNIVPYETFATADGAIAVAVGSERQWPRFAMAIGAPQLTDDPRFARNGDRVANRDALRALIAARLAAEPTATWLARLAAADVPAGPDQRPGGGVRRAAGRRPRAAHGRRAPGPREASAGGAAVRAARDAGQRAHGAAAARRAPRRDPRGARVHGRRDRPSRRPGRRLTRRTARRTSA